MEITLHYTATTVIVHKNKALLQLHKSLGIWVPVGGHIDRDELPEDAARREIKEEAGLEVKLYNPDPPTDMGAIRQLLRPRHILLENMNEHHQHIDFVYYATSDTDALQPQDGETDNLKWFAPDEIRSLKDTPENVKVLALEAILLLRA